MPESVLCLQDFFLINAAYLHRWVSMPFLLYHFLALLLCSLASLNLFDNQITDTTPLSALTQLKV